ncbi:Tfb2-domain-containing protein, partial [Rozella allomycis CSF55]
MMEGTQTQLSKFVTKIFSKNQQYVAENFSLLAHSAFVPLGSQGNDMRSYSQTQKQFIKDCSEFGLYFIKGDLAYPTKFVTMLFSDKTIQETTGFILVETNFRVYAYTESDLNMAILKLFCHMQGRFPNLVYGLITQDSVRKAYDMGITAKQIISFLTSHAHPRMKQTGQSQLIPTTICDQLLLWEKDTLRVSSGAFLMYEGFENEGMFAEACQYINRIKGVHIQDSKNRRIYVQEDYND